MDNIEGTSNNNIENSKNEVNNETSKLIIAITEYIPTFFSPNCVLTQKKEKNYNKNIVKKIGQCELLLQRSSKFIYF